MASGMRPDTCLLNPNGSAAMNEAARILTAIENGDRQAAEQLLPFVYDELRRLAARKLARESPGHTLQATALVHQAYLRLVGDAPDRQWNGRSHFFAAPAQAMRHVLVGAARRKRRQNGAGASAGSNSPMCPRPTRTKLSSPSTMPSAGWRMRTRSRPR
jgi:DNA-directed RNA polymerase specialized sigma24 family protein